MKFNGHDVDDQPQALSEFLVSHDVLRAGVAVAVNGDIIPRSQWTTTWLAADAVIEVVTAAAGG